jgi:hypothetical protein
LTDELAHVLIQVWTIKAGNYREGALEAIEIKGFDSHGEPELRQGADGGLERMFNFMPPLNDAADPNPHPIFETFEVVLANALGVVVTRDDRELFLIPMAQPDTAARAQKFLETFWRSAWPALSGQHP